MEQHTETPHISPLDEISHHSEKIPDSSAPPRLFLRLLSISRWHIATAVLLIVLFVYMVDRSRDEDRWSDWGFGDAQTMLSLKQWDQGGWINNYLLFIPQGYAKVLYEFDDPNLRQHAHGTCPGSSPRIGPRLWYTHYPAGYLVPFAALFKIGFDTKFAAQVFAQILSVIALGFMYLTFARITTPGLSFLAVLFYALSRPFLGYADSLANIPLDDLLRFGFMYAVVMSTRDENTSRQTRWLAAAWIMEFCLSLSSFDSVFFIFTWLVGWDLLEGKGLRIKKWFLFGMAPTSAHGLQFLQNVWYLGFQDALTDIKDAFLLKNGGDAGYNSGQGRLAVVRTSVAIIYNAIFPHLNAFWALCGGYAVYTFFLRDRKERQMPSVLLFVLLFMCGMTFILILPHAARMPYEARQMMPFVSLLVAAVTWSFFRVFRDTLLGISAEKPWLGTRAAKWSALPCLFILMPIFLYAWGVHVTAPQVPPAYDDIRNIPDTTMAKIINKNLRTQYDAVIFDVGAFQTYWDPKYVQGYPQILPLTEYYAGNKPILCFNQPETVAKDISYLVTKGTARFSPILTAPNLETFEKVIQQLYKDGIISGRPGNIITLLGRPLADLTNVMLWRK